MTTSSPTIEAQSSRPSSQNTDTNPTRINTNRSSMSSQNHFTPTPPIAIHPAFRPTSLFSRTSSSDSTSTTGYAYANMSTGSEPRTNWTLGRDYNSMKPGILPNSDWTTGLSYEEMRGGSVVGSVMKSAKKTWLRAYKEELKENFKAMDHAFWRG